MATASITRIGNSVGIAIPKELRKDDYYLGERVNIEKRGNALVITPVEEPMTLQSLMRGYEGPKPEFIDPGASSGKEIW